MYTAQTIKTNRLVLKALSKRDSAFILKLVNTEGWLRFIGDRKITNKKKASDYIEKIVSDASATYWVVHLKDIKIGVITLIKRAHLPFLDIGFAFLPKFCGKGYAYEASKRILDDVIDTTDSESILAITVPENLNSIRLIEKLGLSFEKTEIDQLETLSIYKLDIY